MIPQIFIPTAELVYIHTTPAKRVKKYKKSIMVKLYYTAKN